MEYRQEEFRPTSCRSLHHFLPGNRNPAGTEEASYTASYASLHQATPLTCARSVFPYSD